MREGRPSLTAAAVAAARGIASVDALAPDLLPKPFGRLIQAMESASRRSPIIAGAFNAASMGLVDHLELRTNAIDEALREGMASGAKQLVILGAGLDARAWRIAELAGAVVFEIDHPSTQTYKRGRFETRGPMAAEVRFVPVDFERESLADALANAGHREEEKSFWIWEGVTPYLAPEATRATLGVIAARSARGSRLAMTYVTPEGTALGPGISRAISFVFQGLGESLRGMWTEEQIAELADVDGFDVLDDTAPSEWPGAGNRRRILLIRERLAVLEKR